MKNKTPISPWRIIAISGLCVGILACALLAFVVLKIALTPSKPLTIMEAQSRTPFAICEPIYLPKNANPVPEIDGDFFDAGGVDVSLLYKSKGDNAHLIEIIEKESPNFQMPDFLGTDKENSIRAIIAWVVGWKNVDEYRYKTEVVSSVYIEDDLTYGVFEITSPLEQPARMISWKVDSVFYRVFSHIPLPETQEVARSLTDCGKYPIATP